MNAKAKTYIAIVAIGGLIGLGYSLANLPEPKNLGALALVVALCAFAQAVAVPLFSNSSVSLGFAIALVALLLFGPAGAIVANLGSALVHAWYPRRRPWYKVIFNIGVLTISAAAAGGAFYLTGGQWPVNNLLAAVAPTAAAAIAYYLVNTLAVAGIIALTTDTSVVSVFNLNHRWLVFHYLTIAALALLVPPAYNELGVPGLLLFSLPFLLPWASLRKYVELARSAVLFQEKRSA